ncbi:MAG: tetratricopeptide repeat protein [Terriglobales bacterium]
MGGKIMERKIFARPAVLLIGFTVLSMVSAATAQTTAPIDRPVVVTPGLSEPKSRGLYISGRVLFEDQTVPPAGVYIERVCNTRARREGRTDTKGNFSFQLGLSTDTSQDATFGTASLAPGATEAEATASATARTLRNCELRAVLPGYRSDIIFLANRMVLDEPNVGTIYLHKLGHIEGTTVSATSAAAPKEAKKALEQARKELANRKPDKAAEECRQALQQYPKYADAMQQLGEIYAQQNRKAEAQKLFEDAIAADAKFVPPYFSLAVLAAGAQDWTRVASLTDQLLALNAYEYPAAYQYNAVAHFKLGELDKAEQSARAGRKLDTQHRIPDLDLVLASVLLKKNDTQGAAEQLKSYLKYVPTGPEAERVRKQLAQIESQASSAPAAPPK